MVKRSKKSKEETADDQQRVEYYEELSIIQAENEAAQEDYELSRGVKGLVSDYVSGSKHDDEDSLKPVTFRLFPGTISNLDELARDLKVSRGSLARELLERAIHEAQEEYSNLTGGK